MQEHDNWTYHFHLNRVFLPKEVAIADNTAWLDPHQDFLVSL